MPRIPFTAALVTAVVGVGLLSAAIAFGWLGPDVGRGSQFCEAAREGILKQPVNTLSNGGFVVAGLAIGWQARRPTPMGSLAGVYGCVVVLLGPASAAMHATQSEAGGRLDLLSMYLVAAFAAGWALTRWWRRAAGTFWCLFVGFVSGCELLAVVWSGHIPVLTFSGNVAFAVLLSTAAVLEVLLWRRADPGRTRLRWGAAAVGSILVAFVIWILGQGPWCDPSGLLQAHAVWHLLGAVAAWCLFRLYASERPVAGRPR